MDRSYVVTLDARRITRLGGRLTREDKALANRRARRAIKRDVRLNGEDAVRAPRLWTACNVL